MKDTNILYFNENFWDNGLEVLKLLLKNGYCAQVREEEHALIIEYENSNPEFATYFSYWLTNEEAEYIDSMRRDANANE